MVHEESEVSTGSLSLSRLLISIVAGHKKSDMWREGNCSAMED